MTDPTIPPVQHLSGTSTTVATSVDFTAPTAGNILILAVTTDSYVATSGTGRPESDGWSRASVEQQGYNGLDVWYKVATGAETTVSYTIGTATRSVWVLLEMDGLSGLDVAGGSFQNSAQTAVTTTTITPTSGRRAVLVFYGRNATSVDQAFVDPTWTAPYSQIAASHSPQVSPQESIVVGYQVADWDGTTTTSATINTATGQAPVSSTWILASFAVGAGTAPLTVDAGTDQSITTEQSATLSATASGGSGTKTYAWSVTSGPDTSASQFSATDTASTVFTPSSAGTFVLTCTVTDDTGSDSDTVTVTVTAPPTTVALATINDSSGWTPTGGTVQAVLADSDDDTIITSAGDPDGVVLDGTFGALATPTGDFTVRLRAKVAPSTATGTITGKLYDDTTLRATSSVVALPTAMGNVDLTFAADDIAAVTSWATGVRFTATVSAS